MRPWKSVTTEGSSSSGMSSLSSSGDAQLAQRGGELLGTAARLGQPEEHVARLFGQPAPASQRELWDACRHGLGKSRRSPRSGVDRASLERRDRVSGALGESLERLAVRLQVAGTV